MLVRVGEAGAVPTALAVTDDGMRRVAVLQQCSVPYFTEEKGLFLKRATVHIAAAVEITGLWGQVTVTAGLHLVELRKKDVISLFLSLMYRELTSSY